MNLACNLTVCIAALSLLAACDERQNADRSSFEKALQSYYDAHPVCAAIPLTFPVELRGDGDNVRKRQLKLLVTAGLISVTTTQKTGSAALGQAHVVDYLRYTPTEAGEKVVRKGANNFLGSTDICFARRKVVKIESFAEPAEEMGLKVSRVTFEYELRDVEPWATGTEFAAAFAQIGALLAKPSDRATDVLVQTDEGWKHERDVR